jgi:hypothetical protein
MSRWLRKKEEEVVEDALRAERVSEHLQRERDRSIPRSEKTKKKDEYKRVSVDEDGKTLQLESTAPRDDPGKSGWNVYGVHIQTILIAVMIFYSQCQISFETECKDILTPSL